MGLKNKGIFFSLDALIALIIIFIVIFIAVPISKQNKIESKIDEDILISLSSITAEEFDNAYVQSLISSGVITEPNKSLIEQIGQFYATDEDIAINIVDEFLSSIKTKENIGIWLENSLVSSKNSTPIEKARQIDTSRQIISGIQIGSNITGFSARAFLSSNVKTNYNYFGGYIGDGNITVIVNYNGTINSASIELAINNPFSVYINGNLAGDFAQSSSVTTPASYNLPITDFHSGSNIIEIKGKSLYIAGGFIKTIYNSEAQYQQPVKYYFPGIDGLINIYDGIYIPNNLTSMNIYLHINSSKNFFVTVGNASIYNGITNGEQAISLDNNYISARLNYDELSQKTVPLRLGLENATFEINTSLDIITVNDITSSMGAYAQQLMDANILVLNNTVGSFSNIVRLGIVTYRAASTTVIFHGLSNDYNSLFNQITDFLTISYSSQERSLCNGIQRAVEEFNTSSSQEKVKISILMGAGELSDQQCSAPGSDVYERTKNAACNAYNQSGIIFYTVGFGTNNNTLATLQQIAGCSEGGFSLGNLTNITKAYDLIIKEIIANYQLQTVHQSGGNGSYTKLYPDSYIQFNYSIPEVPYGLLITTEKEFDTPSEATLEIPPNSVAVETRVISYSGPKWTTLLKVNNDTLFNLTKYGNEYIKIGDPYTIQIPTSLIQQSNNITIATGSSPENFSVGSASNKVIYTIVKNISSYSPISIKKEGCTWDIYFEDDTNSTLSIPQNYTGSKICRYSPSSIIYDINDALQTAVYNLFRQLDLDLDGRIDFIFNSNEVSIETTDIEGIPYPWSTEIKVIRWV